jgi:hypothetical protein
MRLPTSTEACAKWTSFLARLETELSALRLRRDILAQVARLDTHPIPIRGQRICAKFRPPAVIVAGTKRQLLSVPESSARDGSSVPPSPMPEGADLG